MALAIGQHLVEKTPPANYHQLAGRKQNTLTTKKVTYFTPFLAARTGYGLQKHLASYFCLYFLFDTGLSEGGEIRTNGNFSSVSLWLGAWQSIQMINDHLFNL